MPGASTANGAPVALRALIDYAIDAPDLPPNTMHYITRIDIDTAGAYALVASRGVAEPGDIGCFELLEMDEQGFVRESSFDERDRAFAVSEDYTPSEGILETLDMGLAYTVGALAPLVDGSPEVSSEGITRWTETLDAGQLAAVLEIVPNMGGFAWPSTAGVLTAAADGDGRLVQLGVQAEAQDRAGPQTLTITVVYEPFDLESQGIDASASRADVGMCVADLGPLVGPHELAAIVVNGTSIETADDLVEAYLALGADGAVSGSTGCQTFSGTAVLEYAWLGDVELEFEGEPCLGDAAELEKLLIAALTNDPGHSIWEGQLLLGTEGGPVLLFHAK